MICPKCGSRAIKNGIAPGHRQKYICIEKAHQWLEKKVKK